jgi:predicted TIM-barrel fold metal-dependent hydrolase
MERPYTPLNEELLKYPKIDVHTHLGIGSDRVSKKQIQTYIEDSLSVGIEKFIISRPFTGAGEEIPPAEVLSQANNKVIDLVKAYPGLIYGYAYLHPGFVTWSLREMDRCLKAPGMVGIKLYNQYRFNDPLVVHLIREAARRNALVLLHQGKSMNSETTNRQPLLSDGYHIARLAEQVPEAKLICGHIGGGGDWEWTIKAIRGVPSVFADTSGSVIDAGMIEFAARELGFRRLLFATDMSIDEGIGKMLGAKIPVGEKKAIFSGNFNKLMKELNR